MNSAKCSARRYRGRRSYVLALVCLAVGGCGSLPRVTPDMALGSNAPPQLESANGVLSAQRSKEILDRLKTDNPLGDLLDRHLALEEEFVASPLVTGNKVVLLKDGPRTYSSMFAAIASARDHINMESYIITDDDVGRRFADALIAKQAAGVQVNIIYDSVGTLDTPLEYFTRLEEAGINLLEFNPVNPLEAKAGWDVNQRDHRKLMIVDGRIAILGGINISGVYSGSKFSQPHQRKDGNDLPWRDTDLQIEGPVVAEFQKLFMQTWEKQHGEALAPRHYFPPPQTAGPDIVRAIGSSPDEPYSLIYATLISAIQNAVTEVWLTNAYFVPDPQLLAALTGAVARGVDVKLLLPSASDSWLVFHAGRSYYNDLLRVGVKIYERHGALLHAKTAVIDGVWTTVGSTNLDWRSFLHNQEINAVVLGTDFGEQMRAMFQADLAASQLIRYDNWQRRRPDLRMDEAIARLWAYWL